MQAKELKIGDKFKLPGQRKFKIIFVIINLGSGKYIKANQKNKLLFNCLGCSQIKLDKETEVILYET
jgi:hypothetical protein